jgi:hypothetical protein
MLGVPTRYSPGTTGVVHISKFRLVSGVKLRFCVAHAGPAFAHGTTVEKGTVSAPHPIHKNCVKKNKKEALQYCDSNQFIELTEGTSRVFMSKASTNSICCNKHKA